MARWMFTANHLVVFTGAGISTESGLPDFRGPDGVWTRRDKGLSTPGGIFQRRSPTPGHMAIVELQNLGNLHLKSGMRPDMLAELHGNITKARCSSCDFLMDNFADQKKCPLCEGKLVSSVVNFGQPLPRKEVAESYSHSRQSDLFVVVGSSLVVYPAADMPRAALESGARLVIINQGETPV